MTKYSYSFILIHGFTMNGEDMGYYESKLRGIYPNISIKFIRPTSSKIKISIYNNDEYNSWYNYYTPNCEKEPIINEEQLISNRKRIHKIIDKEARYHDSSDKVFLVGMSQGCCMVLDAGVTYPKKIGGIIGFKGHVVKRSLCDFCTKQNIWICHGTADKTIYYDFAKRTYDNLKKKNDNIELLTQTCNHSMVSGIIGQMKSIKNRFNLVSNKL